MFLEEKIEDLKQIKLIIWDLDDTFWKGTLSEGSIQASKSNLALIRALTARGIVNSICSKNEESETLEKLKSLNIDEYFVFISVNWEGKGARIKAIIEEMALRAPNVLFIDDNISNLKEAEFYNPGIMVAFPKIIPFIQENCQRLGKDDADFSRLKQYKVLENKRRVKEKFETNEAFLYDSEIKVSIQYNCLSQIERIHELVLRANQLNFTKNRMGIDDLRRLICDPLYKSGCVRVSDKYGEYGMVGFFCVDQARHSLVHFLFSCRTMGMGIEQYIYTMLDCPDINIAEPVSGELSKEKELCGYIQLVDYVQTREDKDDINLKNKILMKGPCDLEVLKSYLQNNNNITSEFNFVDSKGTQVDYYNHTVTILNTIDLSEEIKEGLSGSYSFLSEDAYHTALFSGEYDMICLSVLMDSTLAVYRHKEKGFMIAYGLYSMPITNPENWDFYLNKEVMTARSDFKKEELERFSEEFENIEYTPQMFCRNLKRVIEYIQEKKKTKIILVTLPELPFTIPMKSNQCLSGKEKIHQEMNREMRQAFEGCDNIEFLEVNRIIEKQDDYFDNINHYSKLVYYKMAKEFTELIEKYDKTMKIEINSKRQAVMDNIVRMLVKLKLRILRK